MKISALGLLAHKVPTNHPPFEHPHTDGAKKKLDTLPKATKGMKNTKSAKSAKFGPAANDHKGSLLTALHDQIKKKNDQIKKKNDQIKKKIMPTGTFRAKNLNPQSDNRTEAALATQLNRLGSTKAGSSIVRHLRESNVKIVVTDDKKIYGEYRASLLTPTILLNASGLQDPDELVKLLAHEGRHHEQTVLGISSRLNDEVGPGRGGDDSTDGIESDAIFSEERVAKQLHIPLDHPEAMDPATGHEVSLKELAEIRRQHRHPVEIPFSAIPGSGASAGA